MSSETFTRNWYVDIPKVGSEKFAYFCGHSVSLFKQVAGTKKAITPRIEDIPTAACELPDNFYLPLWYFNPQTFESCEDKDAAAAMLVNGSTVHEALHFHYTKENPNKLIDSSYQKEFGQYIFDAFNVFEDIAIEASGREEFPWFFPFVDGKNTFLFPEEQIKKAEDKYTSTSGIMNVIDNALNLACCYKRIDTRGLKAFEKLPPKALELLRTAASRGLRGPIDRLNAAVEFLKLFGKVVPESLVQSDNTTENIPEGRASLASSLKKMGGVPTGKKAERLEAAITKGAEEANSDELESIKKSYKGQINSLVFQSVVKLPLGKYELDDNCNYGFLRRLLLLKSKNHVVGEPKKHGAKLVNTRLSRIATDGKIFANRSAEAELPTRCEVIMLVDASGSMEHDYGAGQSLFNTVLKTSHKIFETLKRAGVPCAVYAHTGLGGDPDTPVVYEIASYDMIATTASNDERFARASTIRLDENYDGFAIEAVSKRFTRRSCPKLMIVLSDGEPAGHGYGGEAARNHTQKAIAEVRRHRVGVICMSLVHDVVSRNNHIYGKEFNVDATSNLEGEFQNVLKKVVVA